MVPTDLSALRCRALRAMGKGAGERGRKWEREQGGAERGGKKLAADTRRHTQTLVPTDLVGTKVRCPSGNGERRRGAGEKVGKGAGGKVRKGAGEIISRRHTRTHADDSADRPCRH